MKGEITPCLIIRATTPKVSFMVDADIDLESATHVYLTLNDPKTNTVLLEKSDSDITLDGTNKGHTILSQSESLALPVGVAHMMLNWTYDVDGDMMRDAAYLGELHVHRNGKETVITDDSQD